MKDKDLSGSNTDFTDKVFSPPPPPYILKVLLYYAKSLNRSSQKTRKRNLWRCATLKSFTRTSLWTIRGTTTTPLSFRSTDGCDPFLSFRASCRVWWRRGRGGRWSWRSWVFFWSLTFCWVNFWWSDSELVFIFFRYPWSGCSRPPPKIARRCRFSGRATPPPSFPRVCPPARYLTRPYSLLYYAPTTQQLPPPT